MVTKEQALTAQEFHVEGNCRRHIGPGGEVTVSRTVYWRNGKNRTYKQRPQAFEVPVKPSYRVTQANAYLFHVAEDCPLEMA